ncbi:MerR family transcriptional regulator [Thermobifida halotolerans]|uniref:MerR family transcriptional regulator n=1 Tax=Thermobifida halotolerans TaxID=483545 RepID=A0A399G281_9ACTN|nr:MerR family transcriptional regulator [Thermobifida halotolerans]UOE19128.1 MerR family transcriptional regulator [Thermobifida halotolerans]
MRIGELSRRSGVSVPTIKYYVRERMLPEGERTAANQVSYSEEHLRRLRLIRGLIDVGGLPVSTVREVLAEIDRPDPSTRRAVITAHKGLAVPTGGSTDRLREDAWHVVESVFAERGWTHDEDNPGVPALVEVLARLRLLDQDGFVDRIGRYAEAAELIAEVDIDFLSSRADATDAVESAVLGTVLGDVAIAALRRIAQQEMFNRSSRKDC